jgi:diguanylate cyclase (GGDEF)-like protein/PAS domain S-box-containing protein
MTLIRKTALIVAIFTVANIAFGYAIKRSWIDSTFDDFERRAADQRLQQITQAIGREIEDANAMVYEYSDWNATYEFVISGDPSYHDENLRLDVLTASRFDWIAMLNTSGRVVSGPIYDIASRQLITAPEIPQGQWDLSHPLLAEGVREGPIAGLMVTRDGPMVVASREILTSTGAGPARGRVALGRRLNADLMRELGEVVGVELHLWLATDSGVPEAARATLMQRNGDQPPKVVNFEADRLEIFQRFDDLGDEPAIVVGANLPREMVQSATYIGGLCVLWVILQGAILIFIIMVPLHRAIIAPLGVLSRQLTVFRKTSALDLELDTQTEGEIGEISREFGNMLRQLEDEIAERRRGEENLRRAAAVFNTATESIVIADSDGIILDVNSAFSATTGFNHGDVIGRDVNVLTAKRDGAGLFGSIIDEVDRIGKWEGEIWIRHKEGKPIPAWISIGCTVDDESHVERYVVVFNDMTERKKSEAVISHQANYDMLTKLPNRYLFRDRLRRALRRAKREESRVGLLFIDLDQFKKINDTLGHAAGDEALRHAAERINRTLRDSDTAARLGGDEFAIILPEIENALDVEGIAHRILTTIAEPLEVHKQEVLLTASIGAAIYPADSDNDDDLLRDADVAMYRSKQSGGNALEFFTHEMNESAARRFQVESQLAKALELGEFEVYYQPIVALPEARMVGVEALLRWENAALGLVSPAEFIPIAERSGLIVPIGAWVLETACRQVKAWHDADWPALRLAVNLSPREVDRGDAIHSIQNALAQSGLPAEFLEIEVTERVLLDDVERIAMIFGEIKDLGVRLCIDDFGTGYSSLSYLQNFPFDVLKIDRAFVNGAVGHEDGVSLLRAINSMAESLHLEVVAEGVETPEQMNLLSELGCGFAQGYLFCRPMSAEIFEQGGPVAELLGEVSASK